MQEFFNDLGKSIVNVIDEVGKKTEDTLEVQKIKNEVRMQKRGIERDYIDMGRIIYERYKAGDIADLEFVSFCEEIEKRNRKIRDCEDEIDRIKGV